MEDFEKVNYRKFRDKVLQRDKYLCQKCKQEFPTDELDIHHVVPKSHGGPSNPDNIQTFCKKHHRLLHKELNSLDEYAFEFKHFNNVDKGFDSFLDDLGEGEAYSEPEPAESEELGDIDIEEIEDPDKQKEFDEEV